MFKLEDNKVVKRALAFKLFVNSVDFSRYKLFNMIAIDETAVFLGRGLQQRAITTVLRQSTFHLLVTKVHVLGVFWQFNKRGNIY